MARVRTATEALAQVSKQDVNQALHASELAGPIEQFYKTAGMRNPSRSYFLRARGRLHSLKAVMTIALRRQRPDVQAKDFHAADAAARLRQLAFDVVHNDSVTERERQRVWIERLDRPGQSKFREALIDLYAKCALSSCATLRALEAAHVNPVKQNGIDRADNGILLRADLHKLFDADLIAIDPGDGRVHVSSQCKDDYGAILRDVLFKPPVGGPDLSAFAARWAAFANMQSIAEGS